MLKEGPQCFAGPLRFDVVGHLHSKLTQCSSTLHSMDLEGA